MAPRALIVEDDPAQRRILEEMVKRIGLVPQSAESGARALDILAGPQGSGFELVVLDLVMPGMDGLEFLEKLQAVRGDLPVIVQTAQGSIDTVVKAMRAGADDFVVKPVSPERLKISVQNLLKVTALTEAVKRLNAKVGSALTFEELIASGPAMAGVLRLGRRAAQSNIPVLVEGESGVGKEMIARAIHGESARRGRTFVAVNCGAIPENLVESILFGHEKGSFTGASDRHVGKFQEADGGTLFLDEVAELPLEVQVKLLRAVEQGEIDPVGSRRPVKVDIRLVSATNRDMIDDGQAGPLPRGPLLPAECVSNSSAAASQADRGHPPAGGSLHNPVRRRGRPQGQRHRSRGGDHAHGLRLARQRPATGERRFPGDSPVRGR